MLRAGHAAHADSLRTRRAAGSRGPLLSIGAPRTGRSSPGEPRRKLARTNTAMPRRRAKPDAPRCMPEHTHARARPWGRPHVHWGTLRPRPAWPGWLLAVVTVVAGLPLHWQRIKG